MAYIADPAFPGDFRLDRHPERVGQQPRRFSDRDRGAAADVERLAGRGVADQGESAGLGDIIDIDEIAALLAILEDQRRAIVEEPRGKDRQHPGIGIG